MNKRFGRMLVAIRHSLQMTQPLFAESMFDTIDRIKKIELGYTRPDFEFLARLRRYHGVSLDKLFDNLRKKA